MGFDIGGAIQGAAGGFASGGGWGAAAGALFGSGLLGGKGDNLTGGQVQGMVDPFAPYRKQYAKQLNDLIKDPSSVTSMPGYQEQRKAGTENLERTMAARGQLVSGAEQAALQDYGSLKQHDWFTEQFNRLAQLSGAIANPAQGGMSGAAQSNLQDKSLGEQAGAAGKLAGNVAGFFTGSNGGASGWQNLKQGVTNFFSGIGSPSTSSVNLGMSGGTGGVNEFGV